MALFGFGKKKDEEKNIPACACQSDCATFEATEEDANKVKIEDGAMSVKVLGVGCASCHEQYEQAKAAVKSMGLDVEVEYVYTQILAISTIAAIVTASVALLLMNFSRSGRTVDESRAWLKRICITWAILNGLGFIMAYVTPLFSGGQWTG